MAAIGVVTRPTIRVTLSPANVVDVSPPSQDSRIVKMIQAMTASNYTSETAKKKQDIRRQAHENRRLQPNKDELSRQIIDRFMQLPEYAQATTVLFYVDVRDEVRTRHALPEALASGKRIAIPYCVDGELELFHLESMEELDIGMYKILEPKRELRQLPDKRLHPHDLDLIMVPGVAFDRTGGRTGHGKGYYDKLLQHARPDTPLIGIAFECQMFPEIPVDDHDIYMDKVITENAVYEGKGRSGER
ncbi:MAG: 5-formyltetrahydrofolate cyclo-ligase [Pirellulaceae bacterium]|nr:MAG: 5-formyltetrahydrofolate cyclo-ligase [Pirellulaceae bacterium]